MPGARSLGVVLCITFLISLVLFVTRLQVDELSLTYFRNSLETDPRPFSAVLPRLTGDLAPIVYSIFEQVYAEAEPPLLRLDGIAIVWSDSVYKPDVYLQCELFVGGMSTLFSHLKACVSLAIGLGTNLIIPTTPSRKHEVLNEWSDVAVPIGKWLDQDFFINRLQAACPQLQVALLDEKKRPILNAAKTVSLNPCVDDDVHLPLKFCTPIGAYGADDHAKPWKYRTEERLNEILEARLPEEQGPLVLQMLSFGGFFNKSVDLPTAKRFVELTELFRTPSHIRKVLASLVNEISQHPGQLKKYVGVHFRAEQDALDEIKHGWHSPEEQLQRILVVAEQAKVALGNEDDEKLIYLACGEQDKIDLFRDAANAQGWKVIDKWTLASAVGKSTLTQINALDFDHMAMIDSALLLVSDFFIGTGDSAFSYSLAHHRNPSGRFWGNTLELDSCQQEQVKNVIAARTHMFYATERGEGYHCCG